jgi:hypothetical protein
VPATSRVWSGSLHLTLRLLPIFSARLKIFLESDGATPDEVLARLPYEGQRAQSGGTGAPDARRYRDCRQVFQTAGLMFEDHSGRVRVTDLGLATSRWAGRLSQKNAPVLGRHAAYALAACQLRNPTRPGQSYAPDVAVFPFAFIWRAMLELDGQIDSDELNRVIFKVIDRQTLDAAIELIRDNRSSSNGTEALGPETITDRSKNDRIISWIALASFGWLLIEDKRETGGRWYRIRPATRDVLREAAQFRHKHRDFNDVESYIRHISDAACLPTDVR